MNLRFALILVVAIALGSGGGYLLFEHFRADWRDVCSEARAASTPGAAIRVSMDQGKSWHICPGSGMVE